MHVYLKQKIKIQNLLGIRHSSQDCSFEWYWYLYVSLLYVRTLAALAYGEVIEKGVWTFSVGKKTNTSSLSVQVNVNDQTSARQ